MIKLVDVTHLMYGLYCINLTMNSPSVLVFFWIWGLCNYVRGGLVIDEWFDTKWLSGQNNYDALMIYSAEWNTVVW